MNPVTVRKRLAFILSSGLPVSCKYHGRAVTGSFVSAKEEVLLLEYGSVEDYQRSVIFTADAFTEAPRKDDIIEVDGVPLYVIGCREEPGISITVDLRK